MKRQTKKTPRKPETLKMLSLVICSRNKEISPQLAQNIKETIGLEFELINIDNYSSDYSIFQAYNEGIRRAKYQYLCFMHDDIIYETHDWGVKVISHFEDEQVGMIGIAGSPYYPKLPVAYWSSGIYSGKIIHSINGEKYQTNISYANETNNPNEVIVLDGVWFCIPKKLLEKISFDENRFSGFHFYDLDISMQIFTSGYKILTIFDIDIVHFSIGTLNKDWIINSFVFFVKWKKLLPLNSSELLIEFDVHQINEKCYMEIYNVIRYTKAPKIYLYRLFLYYLKSNPKLILSSNTFYKFYQILKSTVPHKFLSYLIKKILMIKSY